MRDKTRHHVLPSEMQWEVHPLHHKGFLHKKQQQGTRPHQALTTRLQEIQGWKSMLTPPCRYSQTQTVGNSRGHLTQFLQQVNSKKKKKKTGRGFPIGSKRYLSKVKRIIQMQSGCGPTLSGP